MKMKNFISLGVALSLTMGLFGVTVSAETQTIDYDSTQNGSAKSNVAVEVDCEVAEKYQVVLPKQVTLDGSVEAPIYEYNVNVKGEISNSHYIRVIPLDGAKLSDDYVSLDLAVTQSKRRWSATEVAPDSFINSATGTMTAGELTPGVWTGKVNFLVTLDDGGTWVKSKCTTPAYCLGYDTNDNGVLDTDEELDTPTTKGKPLGHVFTDTNTFPSTCERCGNMVYAINNKEQLKSFRDNVNAGNAYAGATIELFADIDLQGEEWTPIGTTSNYFKGNFDGHGHSISNMKITNTPVMQNIGLFGCINGTNIFKDVVFINPQLRVEVATVNMGAGALIGRVMSSSLSLPSLVVKNVSVRNLQVTLNTTTTLSGDSKVPIAIGGIVGNLTTSGSNGDLSMQSLQVTNCFVSGAVNSLQGLSYKTYCISGLVGAFKYVNDTVEFKNNIVLMNVVRADTSGTVSTIASKYAQAGASSWWESVASTNSIASSDKSIPTSGVDNVLTDAECKMQTAVDILNTDNTEYVWSPDLEGLNDGYPIIKQ